MKQIKQISIWLIALVVLMTVTNAVQADDYDFKHNGLYYKVIKKTPPYEVKVVPEKATSPYYYYGHKPTGSITIPKSFSRDSKHYTVKEIGNNIFYECNGITSVTIPDGITRIGDYAFFQCNITSIYIPSSVKEFGKGIFNTCKALKSVRLPDRIKVIPFRTFSACYALSEISIPASVTTLEERSFWGCTGLKTIKVHWDKPLAVSRNVFEDVNIANITLKVPAGTKSEYRSAAVWKDFKIEEMPSYDLTYKGLYYKITGSGSHFFHDYVKVAPEKWGMFNYSEGKRPTGNVTIPEKFTKKAGIGSLPPYTYTVTGIGDYAFYNCKGLTSVSIPNGVKKIGRFAFASCDALKIVDIPSSVNEFGFRAFDFCKGLKTVTVHWDNPPVVPSDLFNGIDTKKVTLEVPKGKKDVYRAASVRKDFKIDETTANETVEGLRVYAHGGALHLTLPTAQTVHLYHVNGAMVKTLVLPAGDHVQPLPSGVYLVRVGEQVTKILVK